MHRVRRRYTAFWNFTYITSSSGAVDTKRCAIAPFSAQSFLLNASFDVQQLSKGPEEKSSRFTTQLPAQPTGLVAASAATHASARVGWYGVVAGLVGVAVGLGWLACITKGSDSFWALFGLFSAFQSR
jgi:hypothetical protein